MGMRSPKSNWLRFLTLYLLIGLAVLLFVVNLFSPFSSQAGSEKPTPTLSPRFLTSTAKAQVKATSTAIAAQTALAQNQLTAIATNPFTISNPPVDITLTISDEKKLIAGDQNIMKKLSDQIQQKEISQKVQGHLVALVAVYVGVDLPNNSLLPDAPQVATQIESILMGQANKPNSPLKKAQYQSFVYVGNIQLPDSSQMLSGTKDLSTADLEFYLYSTPTGQ